MLGDRLFRWVLWLAPRSFRQCYGDELLETHRLRLERARARGRSVSVVLAAREILGAIRLVVRLRTGSAARRDAAPSRTRKAGIVDALSQDVRFAVRTLRRNPGYALMAFAVLAVGIGANVAIFSAINAFLFRPLPFADADRLVMLHESNREFGWVQGNAAPANVLDWRERVDGLADVAAYQENVTRMPYVADGEPVLIPATAVTGNFFSVLGVRAQVGRTLRWEDTWTGEDDAVVVLSDDVWRAYFGADPGIVGRRVDLGGHRVEVVGVMPPGFRFPSNDTRVWYPFPWTPELRDAAWFRRAHWVRPIARLAPGVTPVVADAQLQAVARQLQLEYPATNRVMEAGLMPVRDYLIRDVRRPLMILAGAVGLLLLLACANVANLTLVRAAERGHELALRHAVGAARSRVAMMMLAESVLLALVGGVVGLGLGWAGVRAMGALTQLGIDGATSIALDARVVLFTLGTAIASGVLFGVAPALGSPRRDLRGVLTEGGRGGALGPGSRRVASVLVACEVGLALLIVASAGLMARSVWRMRSVDPGFRSDGVLAVHFSVPSTRYPERDNVLAFYDRLTEALEGRAGIVRAGTVEELPLIGTSWSSQFQARGWPRERVGFEILHRRADRGYFEALDIPLVRGRMFGPSDRPDGPRIVVINEMFAREHFPGEDPIGQEIAFERAATDSSTWYEIVGIVGDQHQVSPAQPARAEVFEHRDQDWGRDNWIVVRTTGEPTRALPVVREVLREIDPLVPIAHARPLRDVWRASMGQEELILTLLVIFGAVALLLASVGVYGVTAQAARGRTREIGIRMALGANAPGVVALVLRQSLSPVGIGLAAGLGASVFAGHALGSILYGVAPTDPTTLFAVAVLLAAAAALACYLPARRAAAVSPVDSLRSE